MHDSEDNEKENVDDQDKFESRELGKDWEFVDDYNDEGQNVHDLPLVLLQENLNVNLDLYSYLSFYSTW